MSDRSVLIVAGATGSGKTELAVQLARRYGAEIVGADSRQIYRGMEIGTAMPSSAQRSEARHHLVDFLDPHERYSAARFADDAARAIGDIHGRGKRAIVVGGTGFYIRALTGGVDLAPEFDAELRDRLAREARIHPPELLYDWLRVRDPRRAAALQPRDTYRVLRALEVALCTKAEPEMQRRSALADFSLVFLDVPIDVVDARVAERADRMMEAGFVEEAERVGGGAVAANAVGYPQALAYLRGWSTLGELRESLVRATRRYARRQRAWFRHERGVRWLRPDAVDAAVRETLGWIAN